MADSDEYRTRRVLASRRWQEGRQPAYRLLRRSLRPGYQEFLTTRGIRYHATRRDASGTVLSTFPSPTLRQYQKFEADYVNGEYVNYRCLPGDAKSYRTMPTAAEFYWDLEGRGVGWKLTREPGVGAARDFMLKIELQDGTEAKHEDYCYDVKYSDLCYAVGKALTAAVKKHGFAGFHTSVWESDVNIRHLCFLKACGMGNPDAVQPFESAERGGGATSSFDEELELLMFDMYG